MIKPDVIVSWPRSCDYPLWRQFIRDNRERFNLVIIVFTETNYGDDYRDFIREAMREDYVLFIDNPVIRGGEDWRNVAIHQALIHSYNAEWIWFTEQDFMITDPTFWDKLEDNAALGCEVLATYDYERLHPCNIFIKRDTLMTKTRRNFGIVPDISDHFSLIQINLEENHVMTYAFPNNLYKHLNGLSHNMTLVYRGEQPNWEVQDFRKYITDSLTVSVPLEPRWKTIYSNYLLS